MPEKALDKRIARRTKMVVGLRVSNPYLRVPILLAHTLDISSSGAKIGAVRERMQSGTVLVMQYRHIRTQCRVMWSHELAPGEVRIGIEFLHEQHQFWGLDLEEDRAGIWLSEAAR